METNYIYPEENPQDGCLSIVAMTIAFIIALLMCVLMGSCKSIKYVPVETVKHDSIYINKHDTVSITNVVKEKEYIKVKDSTNVVVDETGKVLQREIWHNQIIIKEKSDSLNYYKALTDSLYALKQKVQEIPIEVERPLSKWEQRYMTMGKVSVGVYVGLLLAFILWLINWIKKRRK